MLLDTKNRFLSLFSGYLHLLGDPERFNGDYDPENLRSHSVDDVSSSLQTPSMPQLPDDFVAGRSASPPGTNLDPWDLFGGRAHNPGSAPYEAMALRPVHPAALPLNPHVAAGGGGGARAELKIAVDYKDGDSGLELRVHQVNVLHDNDVIAGPEDKAVPWPQHDVASIGDLAATAAAQVPEVYLGQASSPESIVHALQSIDGAGHGSSDGNPPASLVPGRFVDGAAVAADAELPSNPTNLVPVVPSDNDANMAVIHAGGNQAANYGGMLDTGGAVGTMVVLGDYHKSDGIFQTNVLVDNSTVVGTSDTATIQAGGNQANNIAEFIQTLDQNPYEMGFFGGLSWHVDRVEGNYYDVKLVTQFNDMRDNDLVQHSATDHYKFVETGANDQANLFTAYHTGTQYDLIVVAGDYFGANWIFQANVLLNSDYVSIVAGAGGAGDETVSTGANWLTNSATIADYSGAVQALTPDMQAVVSSLQNGAQSLDLSAGFAVPGDGSTTLNVLFITGNYYDFNVLQQTNIMSDSDTVMQTLGNGEAGYVSTGGNLLSNEATLISLGPLGGAFVGGNQYSESVLVQTNIITQSAELPPGQSGVVQNDPGQLAPEAAALIQHTSISSTPEPEQSAAPASVDNAAYNSSDPLSSVLS